MDHTRPDDASAADAATLFHDVAWQADSGRPVEVEVVLEIDPPTLRADDSPSSSSSSVSSSTTASAPFSKDRLRSEPESVRQQ